MKHNLKQCLTFDPTILYQIAKQKLISFWIKQKRKTWLVTHFTRNSVISKNDCSFWLPFFRTNVQSYVYAYFSFHIFKKILLKFFVYFSFLSSCLASFIMEKNNNILPRTMNVNAKQVEKDQTNETDTSNRSITIQHGQVKDKINISCI